VVITLAQLGVTYLPVAQAVLGTAAVPLRDGALILGMGVAFLLVLEIEKQLRLRLLAGDRHESA
jgi:hypothetical protein